MVHCRPPHSPLQESAAGRSQDSCDWTPERRPVVTAATAGHCAHRSLGAVEQVGFKANISQRDSLRPQDDSISAET